MYPKHAHIEPTTLCNLNCKTCINKCIDRKGNMNFKQLKVICDKIPSLDDISLLGLGEPFMNPQIIEMAKEIKKRGITLRTVTNATLLQNFNLIDIIKYFDELIFSLDSVQKQKFEYLRTGANFDIVINNIKQICKIRHKSNIKLSLTTVISKENVEDVFNIIDFAYKEKIEKIRFVNIVNTIGIDNVKKELKDKESFIENIKISDGKFKERLLDYAKSKNIKISYSDSTPKAPNCWWPYRGIYITYDGYVTPCCLRMDPNIINFGNIYNQNIEEIWDGNKYSTFRKNLINGNIPEICKKCP